ncbi:MAG: TIGR02996 domain-containing protein [Fimbriiglobus sp.]
MSEREGLIQAIRADFDSDLVRLVYADCLEESGETERAEFIRVQCWLSANNITHPDWQANWQREQTLLAEHGQKWLAELAGYTWGPDFDRGFVTHFYAHDIAEFTWVLGELMRVTPTNEVRFFRTGDEDVATLARCPELEHIRAFVPNAEGRGLTFDGVQQLCAVPHLQKLESLSLTRSSFGPGSPDAAFLARHSWLPQLKQLDLGSSFRPDINQIIELLRSPFRENLEALQVWYLSEEAVIALCQVAELARLKVLDIGCTTTTERATRELIECPYLENIQLLNYVGEDEDGLSHYTRGLLQSRFGSRAVVDPRVFENGPIGDAYNRRRAGKRWR